MEMKLDILYNFYELVDLFSFWIFRISINSIDLLRLYI